MFFIPNSSRQKLILGDCIEMLKGISDNSIDAVVTDPPYEIGFMGRKWDKTGIANSVEMWREVLRVLKPGGLLLSFGGTRTYHRMTCAIEDAGFEIRDQMQWLYGSGFPKSLDVGKAIDKKLGVKREVIGYRMDGTYSDSKTGIYTLNSGNSKVTKRVAVTKAASAVAKAYDGLGTALKPANEPICMARKPLSEKTFIDNFLKWHTGAINIKDCSIKRDSNDVSGWSKSGAKESANACMSGKNYQRAPKMDAPGRFPANIILDETAANILNEQSGTLKSGKNCIRRKDGKFFDHGMGPAGDIQKTYGDTGGAARFFYCAKASRAERDAGCESLPLVSAGVLNARIDGYFKKNTLGRNSHPTVKPIALIRYLERLITPPNGIILDPFVGSGTGALAAYLEGFNFIGIDNNAEYIEIARKRLLKIREGV